MTTTCTGGDEVNALVIDIGAYQCKAGYAGEDTPRAVFGTAVGELPEEYRQQHGGPEPMEVDPPSTNASTKGQTAGDQKAWKKRGLRALNHPHLQPQDHLEVLQTVTGGKTADWDLWDTIVEEALVNRMRCNPVEHPLLCAEVPFLSKDAREKMVEHLFESFSSPAVFLAKNPVLSSFALGRQTSLVVDMGHSGTVVSAVHDGYVLNNSVLQSPVGGQLMTEALRHSLASKGAKLQPWYMYRANSGGSSAVDSSRSTTPSAVAWATDYVTADIKESLCRVNEVPFVEEENLNIPVQSYELPDGSSVDIGVERFKIPEILFNSSMVKTIPGMKPLVNSSGAEVQCIPELVIESVNQTDVDLHKELLSGVILTGGSSLFGSSKERLDRELLDLAPQAAKVKVTVHQNATERKFSVWLGGSILGCLGSFHQLWMSKQEYAENGAALIHRRSP